MFFCRQLRSAYLIEHMLKKLEKKFVSKEKLRFSSEKNRNPNLGPIAVERWRLFLPIANAAWIVRGLREGHPCNFNAGLPAKQEMI